MHYIRQLKLTAINNTITINNPIHFKDKKLFEQWHIHYICYVELPISIFYAAHNEIHDAHRDPADGDEGSTGSGN